MVFLVGSVFSVKRSRRGGPFFCLLSSVIVLVPWSKGLLLGEVLGGVAHGGSFRGEPCSFGFSKVSILF